MLLTEFSFLYSFVHLLVKRQVYSLPVREDFTRFFLNLFCSQEKQLTGSGVDDVTEDEIGAENESRGLTEEEMAPAEEDHQEDVTPQPFLEKTPVLPTPAFPFKYCTLICLAF